METLTFNGNTFNILKTKSEKPHYKIVVAVGITGVQRLFKIWNDGIIEFKKR